MAANLLKHLRTLMASANYKLDAYIIPPGDAHQSEYIADCDTRRAFISKFTGSAGTAIVTKDKAALWTDGRYHLQADKQVDHEHWTVMKEGLTDTPSQCEWLNKELTHDGAKVGVDPLLLSEESWLAMSKELRANNNNLVSVKDNLIDIVWAEHRPTSPLNQIISLSNDIVGQSWQDKIIWLRGELEKHKCQAIVLTALDDVAYLFNLRGTDIKYNPVFFAYAIVTLEDIYLFVDEKKLSQEIKQFLNVAQQDPQSLYVKLQPYDNVLPFIEANLKENSKGKIWLSNKSSHAIVNSVPEARVYVALSPVTVKKSVKNDIELKNMADCHVRDGAALCEYLAWLEKQSGLTEISAADYLENCRKQQPKYMGLSFPTISSSGRNGSIIHYMPSAESNKEVTLDEIYLVDSGAQYLDGTTDVTRTIHLGQPKQYERECFTRVLKGHIQLALTVFPRLTKGNQLDTIARLSLWKQGLDYLHGTGHGVGMYLNVHEGPSGISFRGYADDPGLQEGMILSNEPGYYEDGQFGIRIENLVVIRKSNPPHNYKNRGYLEFETITLAPIQKKMIDVGLLTQEEIQWLNSYHAMVRAKVGQYLESTGKLDVKEWLVRETDPIAA